MNTNPSQRAGLAVALLFLSSHCFGQRSTTPPPIASFLRQHCVDCHTGDDAEGKMRLDQLLAGDVDATSIPTWTRIVDAIESNEMPPSGEPSVDLPIKQTFVADAARFAAQLRGSRPIALRRMNRHEYESTIHDLLGIDVPLMDLLPEDGSMQGFDNVADGLSISSVLMEKYLAAANTAFDATIRRIKPLAAQTRRIDLMQVKDNIESVEKNKGGTIAVDDSFIKFTPGWPPARIDPAHPIEDGIYRCRVAVWPHDPGDRTLSVALYVGSLFGPETQNFIGVFDVTGTPDNPRIIEFEAFMKAEHTIHILPRIWPEHVTWRDKHEKRPGVGIAWAETHGPLDQSFPSEATNALLGDSESITMVEDQPIYMRHRKGVKTHRVESQNPAVDATNAIRRLAPRAFRRPVTDAELLPFVDLTMNRLAAGRSFEQSVRAGVTALLCAPQFLLLNDEQNVDDFTIAERLAYFLWSSMPDDELLRLANEGKLKDPAVRIDQAKRMLADSKRQRFVDNFLGQWLDLRDIEFTTPDAKLYPEFDPLLQVAMLTETKEFFKYLIDENQSVANFIDSDFTFLNERLARHYGIPNVRGNEHFRLVRLPEESVRGGILTHASVLKVTANGTSTSPVLRGVWILDHLMARPSPPPPAGVPAVEPDIRGATTIAEQLDKHRQLEACNRCHRRIDPFGFALESFDAIGGTRDWYRSLGEGEKLGKLPYRKGLPVETASQLADGRTFENFVDFRQRMLDDKDRFVRAIATKLTIYATGRPITLADRPAIDQIVAASAKQNHGLRSMIEAIVSSDLFLAP
ncbi:MAG: DUF1592 domain-containing protein [Pirellulaceae bacterium]